MTGAGRSDFDGTILNNAAFCCNKQQQKAALSLIAPMYNLR
jgi:hypothetical protein